MREVVAEMRNPVMLYSIGKDSSVMLHVAMKAFHPAKPPFPLLHVDTTWKFREMIALPRRDGAPAWGQTHRPHQSRRGQKRRVADRVRVAGPYPGDEDRGASPGARYRALRRGVRRSASRRGEEPRQGAHLFASIRRPRLGSAQSAPRTLAAVQHPHPRGRVDAGVPAVELDRARRLGIRPGRAHSGGAALFFESPPGRRTLGRAHHGR